MSTIPAPAPAVWCANHGTILSALSVVIAHDRARPRWSPRRHSLLKLGTPFLNCRSPHSRLPIGSHHAFRSRRQGKGMSTQTETPPNTPPQEAGAKTHPFQAEVAELLRLMVH